MVQPLSGAQAWEELVIGNRRYASGHPIRPRATVARRAEVAPAQRPFAAILGCSDSRVPPEVLFDQGLGDLFVVRTAGHVLDRAAVGSLEYAVEHLRVPLVAVLGHRRCGAVDATAKGGPAEGGIAWLARAIGPSVEGARGRQGDLVENAVRLHVTRTAEELRASQPILHPFVEKKAVEVVAAYYDLDTGLVSRLG
jgi:carbonic anhydrase